MKKFNYLIICFLIMFLSISNIQAKTCYQMTTKKTVYTTEATTKGIPNTKVTDKKTIKKYCNGTCYKRVSTQNSYTAKECKKKVIKDNPNMGYKEEVIACKEVDGEYCSGQAKEGEVWNSDYNISSPTGLVYVACGKGVSLSKCGETRGSGTYDIPVIIPKLTSFAVNALKIVTPIILIIVGMIQIVKAVASSKEDEIKKAQGGLIKKIIIAVLIFFVIAIVQFVINRVADDEQASVSSCMKCFLNNDCKLTYYRTGANGDKCNPVE